MESRFSARLPHPFYADHVLYHAYDWGSPLAGVRAWEFEGWQAESLSWVNGCYIHAGLSRTGPVSISGSGAAAWLESRVINSFENFDVGSMKHAVMCNDDGLIVAHGIVQRKGEDEFESFAGGPPGRAELGAIPDSVSINELDHYLFQIAGPTSLEVLEKATGETLRDVGFLKFRNTTVNGIPTEIGRVGMTGNLAYELHGPIKDGPAIYEAVVRAGEEFNIQRLGWGTYLVNHVEGGFPQMTWTFATALDPSQHPEVAAMWTNVSGSVDPTDRRARTRTPGEVGWGNMAHFGHDFPGRDCLQAEMTTPERTTVTLRWNPEDVIDTYAALFDNRETYTPVDFPYSPQRWPMAHADMVVVDGEIVGWSSGTAYSSRFGEVISMGCVSIDVSAIGTEVAVLWGNHGGAIKTIRATVERFPYLTEARNSDIDTSDGGSQLRST
ncbi:MAG: aminomethyl transferase family protein [Actinomycetota bacterium]|nr:aminomethyl transferase family protein [Actinomycetota bacterium]